MAHRIPAHGHPSPQTRAGHPRFCRTVTEHLSDGVRLNITRIDEVLPEIWRRPDPSPA